MKILVTGAAGFIGSHLVEALRAAGHQVTGIDHFSDYYAPEIKRHNADDAGGEILDLDLASDDLKPHLAGVDVIYHSAAQPGISSAVSFETYLRNNVEATHRLLQAVDSPRLFVNISTSSVYGAMAVASEDTPPAPISYYGVTKLAAEQLVMAAYRQHGLAATSFRLFSVYGPRERPDKLYPRLINSIVSGAPFPLFANSRQHKRSFTFVGDVVKALVKALDTEKIVGEIINLGTTVSISTGEAIETVEQITGKKAHYVEKPARPGDQKETAAVIDKAQKLLGYHPDTPFADGIRAEIAWFEALPEALRPFYAAKV